MQFVMEPSLQHMTLVKIAVTLWNQNDVRSLIKFCSQQRHFTKHTWINIEEKVTEKVSHLPLPQLLNQKVLGCIKPIGSEIFLWIKLYRNLNLPLEICWTRQGMIDRKGTVEVLVKNESLDLSTRYKLACIYCLEGTINELWNILSEDLKQSFLCENSPNIDVWGEDWLIIFWSRTMKRQELGNAPTSSYKHEFKVSALNGNKVAIEYFLRKLTPQEREECLVEAAKYVYDADVLCFLLTEMDDEQQLEFFRYDPHKVLLNFLQFPWQSFFIRVANCIWNFLSEKIFKLVLRDIFRKFTDGYKDCNYQKLFGEFWLKSPDALKGFIINKIHKSRILPCLCNFQDKENIRLILKKANHTVRKKLIKSDRMNNFYQNSIRDDKWDMLEFCIPECFPSKELMLEFKEKFEKWSSLEDNFVRNKHKWDKLFLSSDDSVCKYKRSTDEGESSSSKRFRSIQ